MQYILSFALTLSYIISSDSINETFFFNDIGTSLNIRECLTIPFNSNANKVC